MKNVKGYRGKKVLITGHTGFKGSWLAIWLLKLGATVIGYALDPLTSKDNFVLAGLDKKIIDVRGDIRNLTHLQSIFNRYEPDIVFHLAAQPLVRASYKNPIETYEVNLVGTLHVLECVRNTHQTKIAVMITTDKCYENVDKKQGYKERDPLGGYDPYSSSKGCAEIAISSWRRSFFHPTNYHSHRKAIASVRAGNVIGGGDWSKDRLVPDCIRSIESGHGICIRNPEAIRPWQHVLEPLSGYLLLGNKLLESPTNYCEAWNFGPAESSTVSVIDIVREINNRFGNRTKISVSNQSDEYEASYLTLNSEKAKKHLYWSPKLTFDETLELTVDWYKNYMNTDVYELCEKQIDYYISK